MGLDLFNQLGASNKLPSPPGVALRILELAKSDEASISDMCLVIGSDPALAGRILKFINSPIAGMGRRVSSLEEAVNRIGLRGVQLMALSFSLVSSGNMQGCPSFNFDDFWSRSLACAVAAKVLSGATGDMDANEAFIIGLLLHVGQLALACALPDRYESILQRAGEDSSSVLAVEKEVLDANHYEASVWLLENWKLPASISDIVRVISDHSQEKDISRCSIEARLLIIADITSILLCRSKVERSGKVDQILELVSENLGLDEGDWCELFDKIVDEWQAYGKLLSVKAGSDVSFSDLQDEAREHIAFISMATQMENMGIKEENQQLQRRSRIDGLTNIANRTCFDERLEAELERARRLNRPMALLMIDIDHFKKFNDTHGHQTGDEVLRVVSKTLDSGVRKVDIAARYGGEEFAIIAPECNLEQAAALAERLRHDVEQVRVLHQSEALKVTISVGVAYAEWPSKPAQDKDLIAAADKCLYQAKQAGRNCCFCETPASMAA